MNIYVSLFIRFRSDYQRISERLKQKRPPPWPSHEGSRPVAIPPRRSIHSESRGDPPTPQHQQSFLNSSLNMNPGGMSVNARERLNTIDIRPQPRMPEGGYDTYDVSGICTCIYVCVLK